MARFQSRLFNWLDHSLPAKLGRRARDWYEQVGNPVKQATETVKKTTTKVILYPVYILAASTNLRTKAKAKQVPLLLKPIQSLVLWIDRNQIFAIEKVKKYPKTSVSKSNQKTFKNKNTIYNKSHNLDQGMTLSERLWLIDENDTLSNPNREDELSRIQKLIKDAIAYFFGKKSPTDKLKPSSKRLKKDNLKLVKRPWLTMADVFDDDGSSWPPVVKSNDENLEQSQAITDYSITNESTDNYPNNLSGKLIKISANTSQKITKSSSKIIPARSQQLVDSSFSSQDSSRPLYAWIETPATFLGYVYNPFMQLLSWLDLLIANIEKLIIKLWTQLGRFISKLLKL